MRASLPTTFDSVRFPGCHEGQAHNPHDGSRDFAPHAKPRYAVCLRMGGVSSIGRALPLQGRGYRFEPGTLHSPRSRACVFDRGNRERSTTIEEHNHFAASHALRAEGVLRFLATERHESSRLGNRIEMKPRSLHRSIPRSAPKRPTEGVLFRLKTSVFQGVHWRPPHRAAA